MSDQIKDEKEFQAFHQNYLQGKSKLSELYQQCDDIKPSERLDKTILIAAKTQQSNKQLSHKQTHPGFYKKHSAKIYSMAASVATFSLVSLLIFNTWQVEKKQLEQHYTELNSNSFQTKASADSVQVSTAVSSINEITLPQMRKEEKVSLSARSVEAMKSKKRFSSASPLVEYSSDSIQLLPKSIAESEAIAGSDTIKPARPPAMNKIAKTSANRPIAVLINKQQKINPKKWLADIEKLIANKEYKKARIELLLFRKNYPDYPLNNDMLRRL